MANCPECQELLPSSGQSCAECGWSKRTRRSGKPERAPYLGPRVDDTQCRIHKIALDPTGYCARAEAWWVPKFCCPHCAGPLWDNGYCPSCTPRTHTFPGDYFEQRWQAGSDREWGHFVRGQRGPTAAPTAEVVAGYLAELRALTPTVGREIGQAPMRQPGDEPAWITDDAAHDDPEPAQRSHTGRVLSGRVESA